MRKLMFLFSLLFTLHILVFAQQEAKTNDGKIVLLFEDRSWVYADSLPLYNIKGSVIPKLEIPNGIPNDKIIAHAGYSLSFNSKHRLANWVAYELTKEETNKIYDRTDKFISDPLVKSVSANDKDYSGSGFDRGHLAPAADMGWSLTAMKESFYYSNMAPQQPGFNRGIWSKLEELVRTWAVDNNSINIVTGPVFTEGLSTIGKNKVSVPNYFYKVILDYTDPDIKGIGFIIPNAGCKEQLQSYAVSIDSVESVTGIDFFPLLNDDQEQKIEKTLALNSWTWKSSNTAQGGEKSATSVQCKGVTKAGARCKNKTLNVSGYCYLHENQSKDNSYLPATNTQTVKTSGTTSNSRTIQTGPRGGQYYYSSSGKKVYVKKK